MKETYEYGILVTGILLNSPKLFDSQKEEALLSKVIHPNYDWKDSSAYISAFNMETEEGQ
jgi:N-methylhydantoinase B/oxoprolinase/acetone carboxylase alpha subunit